MTPPDPSPPFRSPLIGATALAALVDHDPSGVTIIDVRWSLADGPKHDSYLAGHLPGAVFADLDSDLSAAPSPAGGRHPLPEISTFVTTMRRLGVHQHRPVVAYDDAGGAIAARLWWMLDALGHPAAVLDGGIASWVAPLGVDGPTLEGGDFTATAWPPERFVEADAAARAPQLIDARSADRFSGPGQPIDPRPGHIPGARNAPWADNLAADGCLFSPTELGDRYRSIGLDPETAVVAYCGSGVTACHDLLALRLAGYRELSLYVGSWSAWGADPDRASGATSTEDSFTEPDGQTNSSTA